MLFEVANAFIANWNDFLLPLIFVQRQQLWPLALAVRALMGRLEECFREGHEGLPVEELLDCLRDAARGLDYLHTLGIQHRDVKPHNFLLVGGGLKVADFGLAKLMEKSFASNSGSMTPAYAAPEFFKGQTTPHLERARRCSGR